MSVEQIETMDTIARWKHTLKDVNQSIFKLRMDMEISNAVHSFLTLKVKELERKHPESKTIDLTGTGVKA